MSKASKLTIIDSETMRGIIAPAAVLSKKMLADVIDFLELSTPESVKETRDMLGDVKDESKWTSLDKIEKTVARDDGKE